MKTFLQILFIFLLIFLGGTVMWLMSQTVVNLPLFIGVIVVIAAGSSAVLAKRWERVTGIRNYVVNFLVNLVVAGLVLSALVLGINYTTADTFSNEPELVTISRKYTKTRYKSKRVGRRHYTRGEPYKVYFLELEIPDIGSRQIEVSHKLYGSVRDGDTLTLRTGRELLGMEVTDTKTLTPLHPRTKTGGRKGRCRFFGTSGKSPVPERDNIKE